MPAWKTLRKRSERRATRGERREARGERRDLPSREAAAARSPMREHGVPSALHPPHPALSARSAAKRRQHVAPCVSVGYRRRSPATSSGALHPRSAAKRRQHVAPCVSMGYRRRSTHLSREAATARSPMRKRGVPSALSSNLIRRSPPTSAAKRRQHVAPCVSMGYRRRSPPPHPALSTHFIRRSTHLSREAATARSPMRKRGVPSALSTHLIRRSPHAQPRSGGST